MSTVRTFSPCGPCITRGQLVRQTAKFYVYASKYDGTQKRIAKGWNAHVDSCVSCRDHPQTQYPNGYMD
jgi:hypothetical protein